MPVQWRSNHSDIFPSLFIIQNATARRAPHDYWSRNPHVQVIMQNSAYLFKRHHSQ